MKIDKKKLTVMTIDRGISLMKDALKSDEHLNAFRDRILKTYNTDGETRVHLFRKFYYTFEAIYGSYLSKSDLEDEDTYLYLIDETTTRSIVENTPRDKLQLYSELQDKLYDRYCDIDRTGYNYDLYEVLFTFAHNDFFFFTALLVHRENLPAY